MSDAQLKLFIWTEFAPDYTDGLAFAIAPNVETARNMVAEHLGYAPWHWGNLEVRELDVPVARAVLGGG